jgi:hypothetical protein
MIILLLIEQHWAVGLVMIMIMVMIIVMTIVLMIVMVARVEGAVLVAIALFVIVRIGKVVATH